MSAAGSLAGQDRAGLIHNVPVLHGTFWRACSCAEHDSRDHVQSCTLRRSPKKQLVAWSLAKLTTLYVLPAPLPAAALPALLSCRHGGAQPRWSLTLHQHTGVPGG